MKLYKKLLTYILAGAVTATSLPAYAAETTRASETVYEDEAGAVDNEVVSVEPEDIDALGIVNDSVIEEETDADGVVPEYSDYDLFETGGVDYVNDANIDMPDPDELLEGYLETQIYEETGDEEALKGYDTVIDINEETDTVAPLFSARRDNLDDLNPIYTKCYDTVKAGATRIASGEESLGRFDIKFKDMGIQTKYSANDLGVDHIYVYNYSCDDPECGYINQGRSKPAKCEKCGCESLTQQYDYKCKGCGASFRQSVKPDKCSECGGTAFSQETFQIRSNAAKSAITKILRSQTAMVAPTGAVEKTVEREDGTVKVYATKDSSIDYAAYIEDGTDMDVLKKQYQKNRFKLLYSLLADIPYELYWFNKVTGWTVTVSWAYGGSDSVIDAGDSYISFWLPPVPEYKDNESSSKYACDTNLTSAASQVVPKAKAIADAAALVCETDYDKLYYFKKVIQDDLAPAYNSAATTSWEGKYGNPWQLIWVFDEDPETNVVCEGYSKAFKLLCDLSDFDYEGFDCYLISGYLNRSGNGHMWNAVTMDDGYNYLIDITNSRRSGGTENMRLFLKGYASKDDTWYTYPSGTKYSYKDGATYVFSEEELTMSKTDYDGALEISLDTPPEGGYTYTGNGIIPVIKDVISTKDRHSLVAADEPFMLGYKDDDNINAGVRYVYACREGRDTHRNMAPFTISPGNIGDLCDVADTCAQAYIDEKNVETRIDVVNKNTGDTLDPAKDYTVAYSGTRNLGTYNIRINGTGNYTSYVEKVVNMVITSDTIQVRLKGEGEDEYGEVKSVTYSYTGEEVTPEVIVTNLATGNPLVDKKDYTLSYSSNINAGTAKVTITGKGTYTSTSVCDFVISPLDINDASIFTEDYVAVEWLGKNLTPVPVIKHKGRTLTKGTDYTISYFKADTDGSNTVNTITEDGRYIMRIRGKGNFDPETYRDVELNVFKNSTETKLTSVKTLNIEPIPDQKYREKNGIPQPILPGEDGLVIVRDPAGSGPIVPYSEDEENEAHTEYDYKISYAHNKLVGTAYVIITGNEARGYSGQVSIPFNITGTSITKARVDGLSKLTLNDSVYTGKEVTLEAAADTRVSVSVNGIALRYYNEETGIGDYTMAYENNTNAGTATVYFIGKNGYVGTLKKTFKITQRSIAEDYENSKIEVTVAPAEYMKGGAKPKVTVTEKNGNITVKTLKETVDYTLSYSNNKKLGNAIGKVTIKGIGNYKGTLSRNFDITKGVLSTSVELYAPDIAVTPGKEKSGNYKSKVTVTGLDGKKLTSGTDYTLYYYKAVPEGSEDSGAVAIKYEYMTPTGKFACETVNVVPLAKNDKVTAGDMVYITITAFDKKNNPAIRYEDWSVDAAGDTTENTGEDPDDDSETESEEVKPEFRFGRTIYRYDILDTSNDISKGVFKIAVKDYSGAAVTLNPSDFTDARLNSKSTVQLVAGGYDPDTMIYDDDCDFVIIGYANNIKKGTAKVTVRGVNSYSGTKTVSFKIGSKRFIWW